MNDPAFFASKSAAHCTAGLIVQGNISMKVWFFGIKSRSPESLVGSVHRSVISEELAHQNLC
jgi:hypothetical protein